MILEREAIRALLDQKLLEFNRPGFIKDDPVAIPHHFSKKEDIEIAGLLSAIIAWGRRDIIVRSAWRMMEAMGNSPYEFVIEAGEKELGRLDGFVHRTFQGSDFRSVVLGLRRIYREMGGLEEVMRLPAGSTDTSLAISRLRKSMLDTPGFAHRSAKHFADPMAGSSAKRICMYLRWMVRKDKAGVDFGSWNSIRPDQLVCPLDVHTGRVGRKIGLLRRSQDDWKAALELTDSLRLFDRSDPVKYDFSLFGLGIIDNF